MVCALAFVDLFILFIPTEGMIITTSLMRPKQWWLTALVVTAACSLGAFVLAQCGAHYGAPFATWLLGPEVFESPLWMRTDRWIQDYGYWGLWFIALGPLPQQPAILLCAIGHMAPPEIASAVFFGRAPKYLLFSFLATKGPRWFKHAFGEEVLDVRFTLKKAKEAITRYLKKDQ